MSLERRFQVWLDNVFGPRAEAQAHGVRFLSHLDLDWGLQGLLGLDSAAIYILCVIRGFGHTHDEESNGKQHVEMYSTGMIQVVNRELASVR